MERARRRRFVRVYVAGAITIVNCLFLLATVSILKDWLMIGYGVRMLGRIQKVSIVLTALSMIVTVCFFVPLIKINRRQQEQSKEKMRSAQNRAEVLANYAHDSTNPDYTRKRLEQLRAEMPEFSVLIIQCLKQMDEMDSLQERQKALIEANDARYLKETIAVLDNVERRICVNFRNVINLCIAVDSVETLDETKVKQYLEDNAKKLDDTKALLRASADWINQYNAGEYSDRSEVENWIKVIRDSLREE